MAEAKKSTSSSVLDSVKASLGITLLTLTVAAFILMLILGAVFDGGSDLIVVFIVLAVFAGLMGLAARLLASGWTAFWLAAVFGGVGSSVLVVYGASTGGGAEPPFGHAIFGALGDAQVLSAGTLLGAIIALIVAKWSDK